MFSWPNFGHILENDKPMKGLRQEDLVNQELITDLRKEFRMTYNDFYMVLTDMDMKWKVRFFIFLNWLNMFFSKTNTLHYLVRQNISTTVIDKSLVFLFSL